MAYPQRGNHLDFFVPKLAIAGNDTKPLCAINIAAANATHGEFICVAPCVVRQIMATVILATVSTTTVPVITLKKYAAPSAGGASAAVGTISIPGGSTTGQVYYKAVNSTFAVGDAMQVAWTLGTGGSVAGEAVVSWECELDPEVVGNNSDMIASA